MSAVTTCQQCGRARTDDDWDDYSPMQVVFGAPLGWYSGDDGEICGECMTKLVRNQ